ncbi:MAG: sensor histidine kinase [Candidatus Acidiferrales bacterium]
MELTLAEQNFLARQVAVARPAFVLLAMVSLFESGGWTGPAEWFLAGYLTVALGFSVAGRFAGEKYMRFPLVADVAALGILFFLTHAVVAIWLLFLFDVFAIADAGRYRASRVAIAAVAAALCLRAAIGDGFSARHLLHWIGLGAATIVSGFGAAWIGTRERRETERRHFLEKISGQLQFDRGLSESIRQVLGELALAFECEQACLAFLEDELDRIFIWRVRPADTAPAGPETLALTRADAYMLDCLEVTLCWNSLEGRGDGFGWDRRTGHHFPNPPRPPSSMKEELGVRALLAATMEETDGRPAGRVLLFNPHKKFSRSDLRWFEQIVRHLGPPLENIYRMRHVRARAVEAERSRISRDLHDGILQTLLSLQIQLEVLRRNLPAGSSQISGDLGTLQKTVREESAELRRMVTEMRPLRVESADLRELMMGFAERFQNESELIVDLFIDDRDLRAPDRVCREIFQIYRESLNNIKKHAHASHVVVKLGQDDSRVKLVVDDNGLGFSFSGQFTSEELDRLRLGPISIKERTRSVGGNLTVESNPGHGARLTIEIPLS